MTIDDKLWHSLSKIPFESVSAAEKAIILDQANLFFRYMSIKEEEISLAQSYAVTLCDMLYLFLFRPMGNSQGLESLKAIKAMINSRWGKRL